MGQLMGRCPRRRSAETNQRSFVRPRPNDTCRLKSHDIQQPDANELYRAPPHEPRWKYTADEDAAAIQCAPSATLLSARLVSLDAFFSSSNSSYVIGLVASRITNRIFFDMMKQRILTLTFRKENVLFFADDKIKDQIIVVIRRSF